MKNLGVLPLLLLSGWCISAQSFEEELSLTTPVPAEALALEAVELEGSGKRAGEPAEVEHEAEVAEEPLSDEAEESDDSSDDSSDSSDDSSEKLSEKTGLEGSSEDRKTVNTDDVLRMLEVGEDPEADVDEDEAVGGGLRRMLQVAGAFGGYGSGNAVQVATYGQSFGSDRCKRLTGIFGGYNPCDTPAGLAINNPVLSQPVSSFPSNTGFGPFSLA